MTPREIDPKRLIAEAYRIEGISEPECRSIFLDWALSLPADLIPENCLPLLLDRHRDEPDNHPMTRVLREGLAPSATRPRRRGGRSGRGRG